jgi:hypothetical protein
MEIVGDHTMKVLFLDIDGVMNNRSCVMMGNPCPIDDGAVQLLKSLLEKTGASVVLASSWRMTNDPENDDHVLKLWSRGILDTVPPDWRTRWDCEPQSRMIGDWAKRGDEIAEWLSRHPEVTEYAIVDDDSDMLPEQTSRFVQTSYDVGLTQDHCDRLERILCPT